MDVTQLQKPSQRVAAHLMTFSTCGALLLALLSPFAFCQDKTVSGSASDRDPKARQRVLSESIPLPKGATELELDDFFEEITFKSKLSIRELANFYRQYFKKLKWSSEDDFDEDDDLVDLDFEKGDREINVELDLDDNVVEVTISGDGIHWNSSEKKIVGFDTDDIPLLENQGRTGDGSYELFQFNSRQPVDANIKHFSNWMKSNGWKLSATEKKKSATLIRFEKDKLYIRIGLWPHSFSDNEGQHKGTGGAMTGTGLYWSGRQGVADVPGRAADQADKLLGLTPAKRQALIVVIKRQIEQAMTGEAGPFQSN